MDEDGILVGVEVHSLVHQISQYLGVVRSREIGPLDGLKLGHFQLLLRPHSDIPLIVSSLIGRREVVWAKVAMFGLNLF